VRAASVVAVLSVLAVAPATSWAAAPKPQTGRTVVVQAVSGKVLVMPRGSKRFVRLGRARAVPVGSTIDATSGRVRLTSTHDRRGRKLQSAIFRDGAFVVTQKVANVPITDVTLAGGDFSGCGAVQRRTGVFTTARTPRRRLWGSGKGNFRTRGRNGSATVRGTTWLTEDDCAGTMALNRRGKVDARSQDLQYSLDPGQSVIFSCNAQGVPNVVGLYCLAVLSQPKDNIFGFGIAAETTDDSYQLCSVGPTGATGCDTFPFGPLRGGFRAAGVGCLPAEAGDYTVQWVVRGTPIPVPLPFHSSGASSYPFCVSSPPRPGIDPPAKGRPIVRAARTAARASG
jgi:hypothetical protein